MRGGERIAAERPESASQNSFLIPTSQKVAEPRVSSSAEVKNFDEAPFARISGTFERSSATAIDPSQTFRNPQRAPCIPGRLVITSTKSQSKAKEETLNTTAPRTEDSRRDWLS